MEIYEAKLLSTLQLPAENELNHNNSDQTHGSRRPSSAGICRRKSSLATGHLRSSDVTYDVSVPGRFPDLQENYDKLNALWTVEDPCDVTIVVGSQDIFAHRKVLVSYSPYFRAMFTGGLMESDQPEITLHGVESSAVETIINFAYTGRFTITQESVQDVLQAASLLDVRIIQQKCCKFLYNELDPTNCLGIAAFADLYACEDLAEQAKNYAKLNFSAVIECEEFVQLPSMQLTELMKSDYLYAESEEQLYEAIKSWLQESPEDRLEEFLCIVSYVRIPNIYLAFQDEVRTGNVALPGPECSAVLEWKGPSPSSRSGCSWDDARELLQEMAVTVGGLTPAGERQCEMEAYDPGTNSWCLLPFMPVKRSAIGMAVFNDNLYVTGGTDGQKVLNSVQRYNPRRKCWDTDIAPMVSARSYHTLIPFDGELLAVGGQNNGYEVLDSVESFKLSLNAWKTSLPPLCFKRRGLGMAVLNGILYACGGHDGLVTLISVERFDPRTQKWDLTVPMNHPRAYLGCCALNGHLYAIGGSRKDSSSCERLRPGFGAWEPMAPMTCPRPHAPVGVQVIGQDIYAFGGSDRNMGNVLERYDPASDTWSVCASMSSSRCDMGLVVLKLDPSVYPAVHEDALAGDNEEAKE